MALSADQVHSLKQAPGMEGVIPVVLNRWSSRSFADRAVSREDLGRVFEAARWSASCQNEQPWRFLLGIRDTAPFDSIYTKLFEALLGFNQEWAGAAPVLVLGVVDARFSHNGNDNPYALYDLGGAMAHFTLQAAALGMTSRQLAGFNHDLVRESLQIPSGYTLGVITALGYQGHPSALENEKLFAREIAPRERKPLSELVFSSWGTSADLGA
jgi:nitroreductase